MADIAHHLRAAPLFSGLTDTTIDSIAGLAAHLDYADGEHLATEGGEGDAFFVIVDGRVRVEQGGALIRELGPGSFIGEIALIDGRPRTATVTAVGPVRTIVIRRDGFSRLMDDHPPVRYGILSALTERIRRAAAAPID